MEDACTGIGDLSTYTLRLPLQLFLRLPLRFCEVDHCLAGGQVIEVGDARHLALHNAPRRATGSHAAGWALHHVVRRALGDVGDTSRRAPRRAGGARAARFARRAPGGADAQGRPGGSGRELIGLLVVAIGALDRDPWSISTTIVALLAVSLVDLTARAAFPLRGWRAHHRRCGGQWRRSPQAAFCCNNSKGCCVLWDAA